MQKKKMKLTCGSTIKNKSSIQKRSDFFESPRRLRNVLECSVTGFSSATEPDIPPLSRRPANQKEAVWPPSPIVLALQGEMGGASDMRANPEALCRRQVSRHRQTRHRRGREVRWFSRPAPAGLFVCWSFAEAKRRCTGASSPIGGDTSLPSH